VDVRAGLLDGLLYRFEGPVEPRWTWWAISTDLKNLGDGQKTIKSVNGYFSARLLMAAAAFP
jgi:hypothetical protein